MYKPATIFIPFADYHKSVVENAYASAINQTIECEVVVGASEGTPSKLRNLAFESKNDFCIFLDADDTIAPNFVEECLRTYQTGSYVYTSWMQGDRLMRPRPCDPYTKHDFDDGRGEIGGYHLVTTLYPTVIFKALGGFNELLPGMEDTDFYMRSQFNGVCGILCDKPLLSYNGHEETRSKQFQKRADYEDIRRQIYYENGGTQAMAGCCGIYSGGEQANLIGAQEGDIPAMTLYAPATQYGHPHPATGMIRFYPRPQFMGQTIMVAPHDVQAMPNLFRAVVDLREVAPLREKVLAESGLV